MLFNSLGLRRNLQQHRVSTDSWSNTTSHLLIAVALSLHLPQDVDSVVVPQSSAHLVVVHAQMILLNAPESGQAGRVDNLEHPGLLVLPLDVGGVPLARVI